MIARERRVGNDCFAVVIDGAAVNVRRVACERSRSAEVQTGLRRRRGRDVDRAAVARLVACKVDRSVDGRHASTASVGREIDRAAADRRHIACETSAMNDEYSALFSGRVYIYRAAGTCGRVVFELDVGRFQRSLFRYVNGSAVSRRVAFQNDGVVKLQNRIVIDRAAAAVGCVVFCERRVGNANYAGRINRAAVVGCRIFGETGRLVVVSLVDPQERAGRRVDRAASGCRIFLEDSAMNVKRGERAQIHGAAGTSRRVAVEQTVGDVYRRRGR